MSVPLSHIFGTSRASPEASLWSNVVVIAVRDLCRDGWEGAKTRKDVENWIGTYPTRDFKLVASLAGFEPDALWERMSWLMSLPTVDRYEWLLRATAAKPGVLDASALARLEKARERDDYLKRKNARRAYAHFM